MGEGVESRKSLEKCFRKAAMLADHMAVQHDKLANRINDLRRGLSNIVDSGVNPGATIARCLLKQDDDSRASR